MFWRMIESRSDNEYGQYDEEPKKPPEKYKALPRRPRSLLTWTGIALAILAVLITVQQCTPEDPIPPPQVSILVDDFCPQPYPGTDVYFYNRLGGDRGAVNDSILRWDIGQVTTRLPSGKTWGGVWHSLNHPMREKVPVDFSAILPSQVLPAYQSQITGIRAIVLEGTPGRPLKPGFRSWRPRPMSMMYSMSSCARVSPRTRISIS